jgi:integrase/recombinase XerD
MTAAIAVQPEIIEGIIEGEENQNSLSQRQADLFQEDGCEFSSDEEIIADWLQSKSAKTAKTYWSVIKQFSDFCGNAAIARWTKKLILAYLDSLKGINKTATINKKLTTIRSLLNHCVKESYLSRNVATTISTVRQNKEDLTKQSLTSTERIIGSSEVWELINCAKEGRDRLLLKTCYLLGLRAHEVVKIHWNDITPSGKGYKIRIIGKNNKLAFLPIDRDLINELKQISTSGYIFQSRKGKGKLSTVSLHRIVKESAIAAGLSSQISAHWLRHQRCSDLVNSGKFTLSQVQQFMRHSSPTITSTYIHIDNEIGSNALL